MTNREFYEAIVKAEINEEITEFAKAGIAKLDATKEARKASAAEKSAAKEAEKAPIRNAIMAVMTAEPKTATMLIEEAGVEIKPQAIPSLLKAAVEAGEVIKTDVKIKGKGKQRGYMLAADMDGVDAEEAPLSNTEKRLQIS